MCEWAPYELKDINDSEQRAQVCGVNTEDIRQGVQAVVLSIPKDKARDMALERLDQGSWPELYFTNSGSGGMRRKRYIDINQGKVATTLWPRDEVGTTSEAKSEIKRLFDGNVPFTTPKPTRLLDRVLQIATDKDAIVLDSFAGSGTTAHAVLSMNREDGGSRRFILAELGDYADDVTAERVRRVIHGYGEGKSAVEGVDSGFSYYELGPALFQGDGTLSPDVARVDLARYVWATETRAPYEDLMDKHPYLLGEHAQAVYYLAWEPGEETALTYDLLRGLPRKGFPTVIYADRCAIAPERLDEMGVVFKRVPDQIARI